MDGMQFYRMAEGFVRWKYKYFALIPIAYKFRGRLGMAQIHFMSLIVFSLELTFTTPPFSFQLSATALTYPSGAISELNRVKQLERLEFRNKSIRL